MRALVTGGGGFVGRAIVGRLLKKDYAVRSFSRETYPELHTLGVEMLQGDIANQQDVLRACQGCTIVFHVAAKAGIWGDYEDYYQVNVNGTRHVITACRELQISRLVYTSSPSVVFDGRDMEGVDESVSYAPHYKASYPETKARAERLVLSANDSSLATVALRPHLVWGPRDNHLIPGILSRQRRGRLRKIKGNSKLADFTYVDNVADAHLLAAERLRPGSAVSGRAFFISDGQPVPLWEFVDRILEAAGLAPVTRSISPQAAYLAGSLCELVYKTFRLRGEPPMTRFLAEELSIAHWFNIHAAREELGYKPCVSTDEGLERLRQWLKKAVPDLASQNSRTGH